MKPIFFKLLSAMFNTGLISLMASLTVYKAHAAEDVDTITPIFSSGYLYDDNILKLDPNSTSTLKRQDSLNQVSAGIGVNLQASQQTLTINGLVTQNNYQNNSQLNNTQEQLNTALNWKIGRFLEGDVGHNYAKKLANLSDNQAFGLTGLQQELNDFRIKADLALTPRWKLGTTYNNNSSEFVNDPNNLYNRKDNIYETRLVFTTQKENQLGVKFIQQDARYPARDYIDGVSTIDTAYTINSLYLTSNWRPYEKLLLISQAGQQSLVNKNLNERDFDGFSARIMAIWLSSPKFRLQTSLYKEINPTEELTASYLESTALVIQPVWQITVKNSLQLTLKTELREQQGDPGFFQQTQPFNDTLQNASLGWQYNYSEHVNLNAEINHATRDSSGTLRNYESNSAFVGIKLQL